MTENPEMPDTSAADDRDIPDTMPPAGGGGTEADDQPLGVDPEDDSTSVPGIPDVGEGPTGG
jgi:hypothetical protein